MKYQFLDQSSLGQRNGKEYTPFEKAVLHFLDSDKKFMVITVESKQEKLEIYSQFSHWKGKYPICWISSGFTVQISRR